MLDALTLLACVLYLGPVVGLVLLLRRDGDDTLALACAIPAVFAADFLATFALCYLYRAERAIFVRTGALAVVIVALVAWRAWRRQPILRSRRGISNADLAALALAVLMAWYASHHISWVNWIWDREWHTPFTSGLRVQRMPFRNVYEPTKTIRYHLSGDLFAAFLQSLSFAEMNASRALSVAHDLQAMLLVGTIVLILRATTPWSPTVTALAALVPYAVGPMGHFYGAMGMYEGYADFNNFDLSFRPHCSMSLIVIAGLLAWLMRLAGRAETEGGVRWRMLWGLLPLFSLCAITDEISTALAGVTLAALWVRWPRLLGVRRWQGALLLAILAALTMVANLVLAGTIAPGGPVQHTKWVAPRIPHFFGAPLKITAAAQPWKELIVDEAALLFPALVMATVLFRERHQSDRRAVVTAAYVYALLALGLLLFLCFQMNDRTYEGHRFMTAARLSLPIVALAYVPKLPRASLRLILLLAPMFISAVGSAGFVLSRLPTRVDARGAATYGTSCRADYGAHLGDRIVPTYIDEPIWYLYAGCRPVYAAGHDGDPGVVLAGFPKLGPAGFAKMNASFFPPDTEALVICAAPPAQPTPVCRKAQALGSCYPQGRTVRCLIPPASRAELARP